MTKYLSRIFASVAVLLMATVSAQAAEAVTEIEPEGNPLRKLQRGFLNIALSPIEISTELSKEEKNDTVPPSWVAGLGRGSAYAAGRMLVGVYEIVTFPLPYPADYKPVLQPEFEWQHLPSSDKK
ncbi:MAG TPA: exosortase system-associated protein, TIGR04073 family [Candidatus Omnitrophota bacterium]|nr:exosortase system-associated protein, TIGR04073 family [Candidatus Omnitrophota bacterium]HNX69496.1 exosortase system-associated protein, TIGR04073 family [Candidatus Omnitrophota bacterium]HPS37356.1 exosortase system-associated protein, TIGR04073 family [Candidatus Omnitrophota bacterium]